MTNARSILGRSRLTAALLTLLMALGLTSAGAAHRMDRASAESRAVVETCGAHATGNGSEVLTSFRVPGGCDFIGYGWQNVMVARSPSGVYTAIFQADGNLVVYRHGSTVVWHSQTWGNPLARIMFQYDGNVVIYQDGCNGCVLWAADPYFGAYGPMRFVVQNDANLVLYNGTGKPYWSWQTGVLYT